MEVKILEKIEKPLKIFNNIEEFDIYLNKNRDQLIKETTHRLNKEYLIPGYRITKIKGELCLKKVISKDTEKTDNKTDAKIEQLTNEVERIKKDLIKLGNLINEVIESLNQVQN